MCWARRCNAPRAFTENYMIFYSNYGKSVFLHAPSYKVFSEISFVLVQRRGCDSAYIWELHISRLMLAVNRDESVKYHGSNTWISILHFTGVQLELETVWFDTSELPSHRLFYFFDIGSSSRPETSYNQQAYWAISGRQVSSAAGHCRPTDSMFVQGRRYGRNNVNMCSDLTPCIEKSFELEWVYWHFHSFRCKNMPIFYYLICISCGQK